MIRRVYSDKKKVKIMNLINAMNKEKANKIFQLQNEEKQWKLNIFNASFWHP